MSTFAMAVHHWVGSLPISVIKYDYSMYYRNHNKLTIRTESQWRS